MSHNIAEYLSCFSSAYYWRGEQDCHWLLNLKLYIYESFSILLDWGLMVLTYKIFCLFVLFVCLFSFCLCHCVRCHRLACIFQTYRHVDYIMFENPMVADRLLNYWRSTGNQRIGILYGRYEHHKDVPLGIKATVAAIYEPPQVMFVRFAHKLSIYISSHLQLKTISVIVTWHQPVADVLYNRSIQVC